MFAGHVFLLFEGFGNSRFDSRFSIQRMLSGAWTDFQKLWGVLKAVLETKRCFQLTFMSSMFSKDCQVSVCEFRQACCA